ncbi:ABC transporter related protein [Novosphingobium nitrogenifigens DSM 19370]|uniref:ABC transporter related protein n=1 Tax=Novosphingobium nitrogenifigens DSM 19370 TaxID=983920 RepID=F1Z540_9SPHN|nr:ABC transporter ATP-binding protein [Novosphingobium nitrogenifigens]EGD60005.1 ABC transporter related protein [Novosphingobium nitrogenifigens DSM 19370]
MRQGAIVVKDLGKRYDARDGRPTTLKGFVLSRNRGHRHSFWGLRHITFSVPRGRAVGVVGLNGAGKSTLLRLIGGVGKPDEGSISVHGRIGALLDIGVGLTDDLTGRENVFVLGVIAGMLRSEIAAQFDAIVAFAELEEFIDAPVRTYSSGMRMRLAFAVAVHTDPEVLLIDEVLAVGDKAFQQKCFNRVADIRASGCTIFLVSHDVSQIEDLCDDVLLLSNGRMVAYGPLRETLALYNSAVDAKIAGTEQVAPPQFRQDDGMLAFGVNRYGSGDMRLHSVEFRTEQGESFDELQAGQMLRLRFSYEGKETIENPIALVGIYADDDTCVFETCSQLGECTLTMPAGTIEIDLWRMDLAPGTYHVTLGLFSSDWSEVYDYHAEVYPLKIGGQITLKGYLNPPTGWRMVDDAEPGLAAPGDS